jgi:hypothetical protein
VSAKKRTWLIVAVALLGFSCAPSLSLSPVPTLDPFSLNTAIALTAVAASFQTAAVAQTSQPAVAAPVLLSGPTLDPETFNTSIALTAGAAAAQTQAMIPNTLTPSVTPLPTHTASITPTPTQTFVLIIPSTTAIAINTNTPKPRATKKNGGGGGGDASSPFVCKVQRVTPDHGTVLSPGQEFEVVWLVRNKKENWIKNTVNIAYVGGALIPLVDGAALSPLWDYDISGGDSVSVDGVLMKAPSEPGVYNTQWQLVIEGNAFCGLSLTITVQ